MHIHISMDMKKVGERQGINYVFRLLPGSNLRI